MSFNQLLEQKLRDNNLSVTKTRLKVFEVLSGEEPQSMNEIIHKLAGFTDRASVYRTIALFEKIGIIQRIQIGWKYKLELSDEFHQHHHHLTCTLCHTISILKDDETLESLINKLASNSNFKLSSHQIELQGICELCQKLETPALQPGSVGSLTLPNI